MANTELVRLMELSMIHPDDRKEVERIFSYLTDQRKVAVIADWPNMAAAIKRNREEIEEQKRLLLTSAVANLAKDLEAYNRGLVSSNTDAGLETLKSQI